MCGVLFDEYGLGGTGGRMSPLSWIEEWADNRAFMLCAHAIVAHEFGRGRHIGPSIKYALKIMRGGSR